eukprot:TRINITY_DN7211_c0_g5_i1.p1 TRINITY_DN7211_c0_g5~~TRINITY_DN7211_c0_g5_i1.p1  ORF type:complete len:253 (+),score=51.24 TRINITY_DN7211_c0_g5_i1:526-1284(+)
MWGSSRFKQRTIFDDESDGEYDLPDVRAALQQRDIDEGFHQAQYVREVFSTPSPTVQSHLRARGSSPSPIPIRTPLRKHSAAATSDSPFLATPLPDGAADEVSHAVDSLWTRYKHQGDRSGSHTPAKVRMPDVSAVLADPESTLTHDQLQELFESAREDEEAAAQADIDKLTVQIQAHLANKSEREMRARPQGRVHNLHTCKVFGTPNRNSFLTKCKGCVQDQQQLGAATSSPHEKSMYKWVQDQTGINLRF